MTIELTKVTTITVQLKVLDEPPKDGSQFVIVHEYGHQLWAATYRYHEGRFQRYVREQDREGWVADELSMFNRKYPNILLALSHDTAVKESSKDEP